MKNKTFFFTFLFVILSFLGFSQHIHHNLDVKLNIQEQFVSVKDSISFPENFIQNSDTIFFDLNKNLKINSVNHEFRLIKIAEKNTKIRRYAVLPAQASTVLVLKYSGRIADSLQSGAAEYARGFSETDGIISQKGVYLAGSTYWVPTFDSPLVSFTLTTHLPKDWLVVSQGKRTLNTVSDSMRTIQYDCIHPQDQVYLTAARWTEYNTQSGKVSIQAFLRTPDKMLAQRYMNMTSVYMKMYVKLLGDYPYQKFALVENFWETGYGMPSFTLLGPKIIRFPFILYSSYPHELLHNWWGNSVYVAMEKGNWCEGLTAYMADHMLKEQRGQGAEYRRNTLQKFTDFVNTKNDFPVVDFRERHNAAEEAIGYGKSLMFQHMLRQRFGDAVYIKAYRRFYKNFRFKVASFDDIRKTFEQVTGENLKPFFDEWLTRKGAPQLSLSDVKLKKQHKKYTLSFTLSQVQKENLFPLQIPAAVYFEDTVILKKLNMGQRQITTAMTFGHAPLKLEIDPQFDVFRRLDKGEAPPSLTQLFGATGGTMVLPSHSSLLKTYRQLAETWKKMQEAQGKTLKIVSDENLEQLPAKGAVWIVGFENKFAPQFNVEKDYASFFTAKQLKTMKMLREKGSLVFAVPNPAKTGQTIGFVATTIKEAVPGLTRLLPHYGKYSYLGFEGQRPNNVLKGTFPPLHSPLHFKFSVSGNPAVTSAILKPENPLITLR